MKTDRRLSSTHRWTISLLPKNYQVSKKNKGFVLYRHCSCPTSDASQLGHSSGVASTGSRGSSSLKTIQPVKCTAKLVQKLGNGTEILDRLQPSLDHTGNVLL